MGTPPARNALAGMWFSRPCHGRIRLNRGKTERVGGANPRPARFLAPVVIHEFQIFPGEFGAFFRRLRIIGSLETGVIYTPRFPLLRDFTAFAGRDRTDFFGVDFREFAISSALSASETQAGTGCTPRSHSERESSEYPHRLANFP